MKNIIAILFIAGMFVFTLSGFNNTEINNDAIAQETFEVPENITAIFEKSCMGCHNAKSKNKKAKLKLKLDQLSTLKKSKLISKLSKIAKEVEKGDMPTKKFAEHNPDRMPTVEEQKELIDWARNTANSLAGE